MGCCGGGAADEEAPPARPPAKMASQKSNASSGRLPPSRSTSHGSSGFGPLSRDQYVSRLAHSGTVLETKVPLGHGASYTLQYAYVSQRCVQLRRRTWRGPARRRTR
jgi:hypothetical protein